jgi:general secretion pathway protein J
VIRRSNREAGFTLIEALIGITLLAMLATLIATGTRAGGRAWNSAERQAGETDDIETVQGLLRRTIARARPSFAASDPGDMTVAFKGEPNSLTLVTAQPGSQDNGPWTSERFYVSGSGNARALFMSWQTGPSGASAAPPGEAVLLEHVAAIRFAYFGPPRPGEGGAWLEQWADRDSLPQLVRVVIEREGSRFAAWPELVVATRITGNAGCVYDALSSTCRRTR